MKQTVRVCLGKAELDVGELIYARQGQRQHSAFAYSSPWLSHPDRFELSPDLPLVQGHQNHRAPTQADSVFHHALADNKTPAWAHSPLCRCV